MLQNGVKIKENALISEERPIWPMIVLKTRKGWTGPKEVVGTFKSHQVPIIVNKENISNLKILESWLKSYKPEELFITDGTIKEDIKSFCPPLEKTCGLNPNTNGGIKKELILPENLDKYALKVKRGQKKS